MKKPAKGATTMTTTATRKTTTKKDVAELILSMAYGELTDLCESIIAIQRSRTATTREELAAVLYEWANTQ